MAKIRDSLRALQAARQEYHEKANTLTPPQIAEENAKIKALAKAHSDSIAEGAEPCPKCEAAPIGIFHEGTPNPFEIGCTTCRNTYKDDPENPGKQIDDDPKTYRTRAALPEDAVDDWNAGKYLPPREPDTAVLTHRAANGDVISEKTVKVQRVKSKLA